MTFANELMHAVVHGTFPALNREVSYGELAIDGIALPNLSSAHEFLSDLSSVAYLNRFFLQEMNKDNPSYVFSYQSALDSAAQALSAKNPNKKVTRQELDGLNQEQILKLAEEAYGKDGLDTFFSDYLSQMTAKAKQVIQILKMTQAEAQRRAQ